MTTTPTTAPAHARHVDDEDSTVSARGPGDVRIVRRWINALLIAIVLAIVLAAAATVAATNHRGATSAGDDTVRRIGERTADLVEGHLGAASSSIALLEALAADEALTGGGDEIDRSLAALLVASPHLAGAFVGYPDGSFRFAQRDGDELLLRRIDGATGSATDSVLLDDLTVGSTAVIDTDYDPRERPWFAAAENSAGSAWTEPYVFFRSGRPGVTLARAVRNADGATRAVFGVDVSLAELQRFLDDLPIDEGAEAFLTAGATIVAAPASHDASITDGDELVTVEDIGLSTAELQELVELDEPLDLGDQRRFHRIELDGDDVPDWAVLIRTDRIGLVDALDDWSRLAIITILVTGLLLALATPLLTRWLRRPIEELSRQARIDSLTDVANRHTFLAETSVAMKRSRRLENELTIAVIDIDDFKQFNDRYGHAVGDRVLHRVGQTLRQATRPVDIVGRLGGDELAVTIDGLDRRRVDGILQRVQARLQTESGSHPSVSVTIGVTTLGQRDIGLAELIEEADEQLLAAKHIEKGTISWRSRPERPSDVLSRA